ncbi:hypothetical protein [Pedobacter sp. BMA]|uniref:hypothetical protein n=1 Tax=Pedobacter sp. BMA TaxID=1663685 RepID=UPI0012E04FE6|nr:hypothetical protein [Pedobacter sp. BMA]
MKRNDEIKMDDYPFLWTFSNFSSWDGVACEIDFLDDWLQMLIDPEYLPEGEQLSRTMLFYDNLIDLFDSAYRFNKAVAKGGQHLVKLSTLSQYELFLENDCIPYQTRYLNEKERLNPSLCLAFIEDKGKLKLLKEKLARWFKYSLLATECNELSDLLFPLLTNIRKLIEATFLLKERLKETAYQTPHRLTFKDTCPYLLSDDMLHNPYLQVIQFFEGASLHGARRDLRDWLKACMTDGVHLKPGDMNYSFERLTLLIQAAHLIVEHKLPYRQQKEYCTNKFTFGDWIQGVRERQLEEDYTGIKEYELTVLTAAEIQHPLEALAPLVDLESIKEMRYGLKEWLYYAGTDGDPLALADDTFGFPLFEKLEKLVELCFVLVVLQTKGMKREEVENGK